MLVLVEGAGLPGWSVWGSGLAKLGSQAGSSHPRCWGQEVAPPQAEDSFRCLFSGWLISCC